ncbi:hypothetical protein Aperf_G00000093891 [Anoplocephala perfoliata]
MSNTGKYKLGDAQKQCKNALSEYPGVEINVAEIHDENDFQALKHVVVNMSLKEKVILNAKRQIKDCLDRPDDFDENVMEFQPTSPHVGTTTAIACKTGFYPAATNSGRLTSEEFHCVGKRSQSSAADPSKYAANFLQTNSASIKCETTLCTFRPEALFNAKVDTIQPQNQDTFKYGENVTFECATGFVYMLDAKEKKATMQCLSHSATPYQGTWYPDPSQACSAVHCSGSEMIEMVPKHATLAGARSRLTEEEFGPLQQNAFNQYGNVVTYKCQDAYLYSDRKLEKYLTCTLNGNSDTEGEWKGYSGTSLPLPSECEPVQCLYEDALLKNQDNNIMENVTIEFNNGTSVTLKKIKSMPYPYKTVIRYVCKDGFESMTKMTDQNLTCGALGKWIPQLTNCIKKDEEMTVSLAGRYVPQVEEAQLARPLGLVVGAIIIVFLVCLLLLDLATIHRDIGLFVNNIRLQKRLWQAKKRLREAKKQAIERRCIQ